MSTFILWMAGSLAVLLLIGWLGLQIRPAPFAPFPLQSEGINWVATPENLPGPVSGFYTRLYGNEMPVVESAVISGRAKLRVMGITFPSRYRFSHVAGQAYRHYIEATWFGLPVMKINESFLEEESRLELPFGISEGSPKQNQAANLGLWAESFWFPSLFLTDQRVSWRGVDSNTARLTVPFEEGEDTFIVRFDPETQMMLLAESMRYKDRESERKTLWINQVIEWEEVDGQQSMAKVALIWLDDGTPWATLIAEEIVLNADLSEYIRQRGP